jgi:hypothetical protein
MARFSRSGGRWSGRSSRPQPPAVDPYAPGSARYEERHREAVTQLPCGTLRVDAGAPIAAPGRTFRTPKPRNDAPAVTPQAAPEAEAPSAKGSGKPEDRKGRLSVY